MGAVRGEKGMSAGDHCTTQTSKNPVQHGIAGVSDAFKVPPRGVEPLAKPQGNKVITGSQRAKNSAIESKPPQHDPDLTAVIKAWTELPEVIRTGILALIRAAE